jgi:hypothetical protein
MGICYTRPIENEQHACSICFDNINLDLHDRHALRHLTTPCCKQSIHQTCWEKSINASGRCPFCRDNIVPEEFMKTIRFCVRYEMNEGTDLHDALTQTCCFAKCPIRDQQISKLCFLGETVCFTDDMYWNKELERHQTGTV